MDMILYYLMLVKENESGVLALLLKRPVDEMTEYLERIGDAHQLLRIVLNKWLGRFHSFT
jgi:hypothetical protein